MDENQTSNEKRQMWNYDEDNRLVGLVKIHGENWAKIAEAHTTRTGKQCRERWLNHLKPTIKVRVNWTPEEERMLIDAHSRLGNKWTAIAGCLDRTDNEIKNHWNTEKRKILAGRRQPTTLLQQYIHKLLFGNNQTIESSFNEDNLSLAETSMRENITLTGEGSGIGAHNFNEPFFDNIQVTPFQTTQCSSTLVETGALFFNERFECTNVEPNPCLSDLIFNETFGCSIEEADPGISEAMINAKVNELRDLIGYSNQPNLIQHVDCIPYFDDELGSLIEAFNMDTQQMVDCSDKGISN